MFPADSYPLARRDILTLAGLASISPASAFAARQASSGPKHQLPTRHAGVSSTRCSATSRRATAR